LAVVVWVRTLRHQPIWNYRARGDDGLYEMEKFYKDHRIEISGWLDNDGWFISVSIYHQHKEGLNILVTFPLSENFATYGEAVVAGFAAAQKWIDKEPSQQ
jgi:hypothetical protein